MNSDRFRKYTLVSNDELMRMRQQRELRQYDPKISVLAQLDREMRDLLQRSDIGSDEKMAMFQNVRHYFENILKSNDVNLSSIAQPPPQAIIAARNTSVQTQIGSMKSSGIQTDDSDQNTILEVKKELEIAKDVQEHPQTLPPLSPPPASRPPPPTSMTPQDPRIPALIKDEELDKFVDAAEARPTPQALRISLENTNKNAVSASKFIDGLSLPDKRIPKARLLFETIQIRPDAISFDEKGTLKIKGETIVGSSFPDLFRDLFISKHDHNTIGMDKFLQALGRIGVVQKSISNKQHKDKLPGSNQIGLGKRRGKKIPTSPPGKRIKLLRVYK